MKKEFNITGTCYREDHYMMDNTSKLKDIFELIEKQKYFTINRPRQYGKTTSITFLKQLLNEKDDYMAIHLNFQGIGSQWYVSDDSFAQNFIQLFSDELEYAVPEVSDLLKDLCSFVKNLDTLSKAITKIMHRVNKKVVLLIDEVDSGSNHLPFLHFLGMLRNKYLRRKDASQKTFHSIVLVGVHDIKTLKIKMRPEEDSKYNSPWNVATDFKIDMNFYPPEIIPMLEEYSEAEDVKMDAEAMADKLFYYTSGYPFLVSKLCKTIAEDVLPKKQEEERDVWTMDDLEDAVQLLLRENNTNFDSLIKNLENNEDLYGLVYQVCIEGEMIPFNQHEPNIHLGVTYGIFKDNGELKIHNIIYSEIIYNYMTAKQYTKMLRSNKYFDFGTHFINDDGTLNLEGVLLRFQRFMKEQYSKKDIMFLEREWRIVFLAFLKPIINGHGYDFKEVETIDEKRMDIVVTFKEQKYVIELKIWRGAKYHKKGLDKLNLYLEGQSLTQGYLIIFNDTKRHRWKQELIKHKGKEIFSVWV